MTLDWFLEKSQKMSSLQILKFLFSMLFSEPHHHLSALCCLFIYQQLPSRSLFKEAPRKFNFSIFKSGLFLQSMTLRTLACPHKTSIYAVGNRTWFDFHFSQLHFVPILHVLRLIHVIPLQLFLVLRWLKPFPCHTHEALIWLNFKVFHFVSV